ncbi:MAG TPA: NADP-dependent oxidoreductase [Thermoleophilaceae bacterium]|nr:NADP-dependent oxidoreductase [Thermoleophilaceae bacterium]
MFSYIIPSFTKHTATAPACRDFGRHTSKGDPMRAFIVPEFGHAGKIEEQPVPEPGEGQVLVRVRAAGVNAADVMVRAGYLKDYMEHRFPLIPGRDFAGIVEAVGSGVTEFSAGDEVFGSADKPYQGEGSFAEYVTAFTSNVARRPDGVSVEQAAALPVAGGTALAALDALGASEGDTIAVVGAAGGVGSFVTGLAAARGLQVVAITKGANAEYVRGLGAADVIDYTAGEVLEQLRNKYPDGLGGVIDLFNDAQGAAALASAVRPGGRVVSSIAMGIDEALAGQPVAGQLVQAAVDRVAELAEVAASGKLQANVEVLPLEQAADALDRQMSKQVRGKQVLAVAKDA